MLKKRGQLTIFIIVAIVAVVAIVFFYLRDDFRGGEKYDPRVEVLKQNVIACFTENYEGALSVVGAQGGYLNVPNPKTQVDGYFFTLDIPYYYSSGELYVPTIENVEDELEKAVDLSLDSCLSKEVGNDYDFVEFGTDETSVVIEKDNVIFVTSVLMTVGYDNKSVIVDLGESPISIDSDIFYMHEIASYIANYLKNNNEWVPYSDVVSLANNYDLYVNIIDSDDGSENSVSIESQKEGYYPSVYLAYNKFGGTGLSEIEPLL